MPTMRTPSLTSGTKYKTRKSKQSPGTVGVAIGTAAGMSSGAANPQSSVSTAVPPYAPSTWTTSTTTTGIITQPTGTWGGGGVTMSPHVFAPYIPMTTTGVPGVTDRETTVYFKLPEKEMCVFKLAGVDLDGIKNMVHSYDVKTKRGTKKVKTEITMDICPLDKGWEYIKEYLESNEMKTVVIECKSKELTIFKHEYKVKFESLEFSSKKGMKDSNSLYTISISGSVGSNKITPYFSYKFVSV